MRQAASGSEGQEHWREVERRDNRQEQVTVEVSLQKEQACMLDQEEDKQAFETSNLLLSSLTYESELHLYAYGDLKLKNSQGSFLTFFSMFQQLSFHFETQVAKFS